MTKAYIYTNAHGVEAARECSSIEEAARTILGHDGHVWSIEADEEGGYWLYRSRFGGGGNWPGGKVRNLIYSAAESEAEAEAEIYAEVVAKADRYGFDVLNEAEFRRALAEASE